MFTWVLLLSFLAQKVMVIFLLSEKESGTSKAFSETGAASAAA